MTGQPEKIGQEEMDNLLREAQRQTGAPTDVTGSDSAGSDPAASLAEAPTAVRSSVVAPANENVQQSDIDALLQQAQDALDSVDQPQLSSEDVIEPFEFTSLSGAAASTDRASLELVRDVELNLKIELGRTYMKLEDVLGLGKGSVVPLDKRAGDPVDIYVNGRLIARGEVLVLNDNFCVRVAELVSGKGTP